MSPIKENTTNPYPHITELAGPEDPSSDKVILDRVALMNKPTNASATNTGFVLF
jgi:hypothetical protein